MTIRFEDYGRDLDERLESWRWRIRKFAERRGWIKPRPVATSSLASSVITREALKMLNAQNAFMHHMATTAPKPGATVSIKLPDDFKPKGR